MITKLRASKITIEMPREDGEVWIHVTVQKVIKDDDGKVLNIIPRFENVSTPLRNIAYNTYTFQDLILGKSVDISGYGVASALTVSILRLLQEKYGGEVDYKGDLIIWLVT